ncbi:MAG: RnfABCDGE type electron transport complex subunit D [bacterium]|nr:RnfABCDGE type electron transport complex subunit D [bacterium]
MTSANARFLGGSVPFIRDNDSVRKMMWTTAAALAPLASASVWIHGPRAAWFILSAVIAASAAEWAALSLRRRPVTAAAPPSDGSAFLTGLLLSLSLPVTVPLWMPAAGAVLAVGLGKQVFGGLGRNPLNPALCGRLMLTLAHPAAFASAWNSSDGLTAASPLIRWRAGHAVLIRPESLSADRIADATVTLSQLIETLPERFVAHPGSCPAETSTLLILFGAGILLYRRVIGWKIPIAGLLSSVALFWAFGGTDGAFSGDPLLFLPNGAFLFMLFFMATDPVTSPVRPLHRWLYGAGFGGLTVLLRLLGPWPEGAGIALLLMNGIHALLSRRKPTRPPSNPNAPRRKS